MCVIDAFERTICTCGENRHFSFMTPAAAAAAALTPTRVITALANPPEPSTRMLSSTTSLPHTF